jgi:hypothetical protein
MINEKGTKNKRLKEVISGVPEVFKAIQAYRTHRSYRRLFTPLVMIWCLIYQRLNGDHSCDAVVSHMRSGGFDHVERDTGKAALSERCKSDSTAGFCKARQRLPVAALEQALAETVQYAQRLPYQIEGWLDRAVFLLDGSTLQLRPYPELVREYGIHGTTKTTPYWVICRIVCLFCLHTGIVLRCSQGSEHKSEPVLAADCVKSLWSGDLCIGDRIFGIFQVVQAVREARGEVLFRLGRLKARKLHRQMIYPGQDLDVVWSPSDKDTLHPGMSTAPVAGRLIYVRLERPGFRSQDLYLFTTLLDRERFTRDRLIQLYGLRWHVELNLRYLKDTLDLHRLEAKHVDVVRKELLAGMIAYNLVRIVMIQTALQAGCPILHLSFAHCLHRLTHYFSHDCPFCPSPAVAFQTLLSSCAHCRLPRRPAPRIEPRWVRPRDNSFPEFWIDRPLARRVFLKRRFALAVY